MKTLSTIFALLILSHVMIGCGSEFDNELSLSVHEIQYGTVTNDFPAVGKLTMIFQNGTAAICTGALVGCKTVLTAAHCLFAFTFKNGQKTAEPKPRSIKFEVGAASYDVDIAQSSTHPAWDMDNNGLAYNDVAVFRLTAAPPIKPLPIAMVPPKLNQQLTLVGFGLESSDPNQAEGIKRVGTRTDYDLGTGSDQTRISYNGVNGRANICHGDSGGPTLAMINGVQSVVGVHSVILNTKPGNQCAGKMGQDMRVDKHATGFIIPSAKNDIATSSQPNLTCSAAPLPQAPNNPQSPGNNTQSPSNPQSPNNTLTNDGSLKIQIASPTDGAKITDNQLSVVPMITYKGAQVAVWLTIDASNGEKIFSNNNRSFEINLKNGPHTLYVHAQDLAGNVAEKSVQVQIGETTANDNLPTQNGITPNDSDLDNQLDNSAQDFVMNEGKGCSAIPTKNIDWAFAIIQLFISVVALQFTRAHHRRDLAPNLP